MGQDKLLGPARLTWEGLRPLQSPYQRGSHRATTPFTLQGQLGTYPIGLSGTPRPFLTHPCSCSSLEHPLPSPLSPRSYQGVVLGPVRQLELG